MAINDFTPDDYGQELVRVRKDNDALKAQNALLLKLAKQAIVQGIMSMDIVKFLQFATSYEELRR